MLIMIPFITNDQYNFIIKRAKNIAGAAQTVNDAAVKRAFIYLNLDKVLALFPDLNKEQETLLSEIVELDSDVALQLYKEKLKNYCIPFVELTDAKVKKLFRKVKKLNHPTLSADELKHLTYFGWNDAGSNQKFIIKEVDGKLSGIHGRFLPSSKKGFCHFCHQQSEVGLFTVEVKMKGTAMNYRTLANYVCIDSAACNNEITDTERVDDFIRNVSV